MKKRENERFAVRWRYEENAWRLRGGGRKYINQKISLLL